MLSPTDIMFIVELVISCLNIIALGYLQVAETDRRVRDNIIRLCLHQIRREMRELKK